MRKMSSEMPRATPILSFRLSAAHGARGPAACHFERHPVCHFDQRGEIS